MQHFMLVSWVSDMFWEKIELLKSEKFVYTDNYGQTIWNNVKTLSKTRQEKKTSIIASE